MGNWEPLRGPEGDGVAEEESICASLGLLFEHPNPPLRRPEVLHGDARLTAGATAAGATARDGLGGAEGEGFELWSTSNDRARGRTGPERAAPNDGCRRPAVRPGWRKDRGYVPDLDAVRRRDAERLVARVRRLRDRFDVIHRGSHNGNGTLAVGPERAD
jgi:hypothetical protein